ncbi:MAG: hypothetical protein RLZZ338_2610 [Cyanobacteriota bacterium]|jgi:hypothetical protein
MMRVLRIFAGASQRRKLAVGWRSLCGASQRLAPY